MKMKKILALIMALCMVMALAACGETDANEGASADASAEASDVSETAESYTIGVCQLVEHPALDAATQGFQDALKEKLGDGVTFDIQTAQGDSATCSTITNTFVANQYDLIMANATAALQAAIASTSDIPVLGTSVTDYATAMDIDDWTGITGTNVSGTSDLAPLDQQAECIKEIFPDAQTIGILYCSAEPNSKYQATVITGYLEEMGYTVSEYTFADSNDVAAVTQSASTGCDVIYIPTDNTAADCTEAIANVVLADGTPVFAGEEGICTGCGVATLSISYYDLGYATGEMAYEILVNGADPSTMEIQYAPNVVKEYNAANAEALGITIPDGYEAIAEE